jgi:hypothetical protein
MRLEKRKEKQINALMPTLERAARHACSSTAGATSCSHAAVDCSRAAAGTAAAVACSQTLPLPATYRVAAARLASCKCRRRLLARPAHNAQPPRHLLFAALACPAGLPRVQLPPLMPKCGCNCLHWGYNAPLLFTQ